MYSSLDRLHFHVCNLHEPTARGGPSKRRRGDALKKQQRCLAVRLTKSPWMDFSSKVGTRYFHQPQWLQHKDDVTALHISCLTMTSKALFSPSNPTPSCIATLINTGLDAHFPCSRLLLFLLQLALSQETGVYTLTSLGQKRGNELENVKSACH